MTDRRRRAEIWGRKAERRAALFLRLKGYRIAARRYRTPMGEIDLVVRRGSALAFVEIKARDSIAAGLEAVTPAARKRIARAAEMYLARSGESFGSARFDVIVVVPGRLPRHVADAWRPAGDR